MVTEPTTPDAIDALRVYLKAATPPIEVTAAVLGSDGTGLIEARYQSSAASCYFGGDGHPRHDFNLDGSPVRRNAPKRLSSVIADAFAAVLTDSAVAA